MSITDLLATASAAVGGPLAEPVELGGSDRTTVLRCRAGDGSTVVVKAHHDHSLYFAVEATGLTFSAHGPRLLAVDQARRLIVMSDLGAGPSLADALLGTSAEAAEAALLAWAACYGRIAAETSGRRPEFDALLHRYGGAPQEPSTADRFERALAALGVRADGPAPAEPTAVPVFSPGDICPDNNVLVDGDLHVLDFEGASFHSVFLDAAYSRMPFATCWCVFGLPDGLAERIEATYRAEVVTVSPALADDAVWRSGVRQAIGWWTVHNTAAMGAFAATGDKPMHSDRRPVPTVRQLLRHRWRYLVEDEPTPLTETFERLLAATRDWDVDPLPLYPAFTPSPPTIVSS